MTRNIVVVDTETNGLDLKHHQAVEVAWWNLTTDERGVFIPLHNQRMVLHDADLPALRINGYIDRIADHMLAAHESERAIRNLYGELRGATLAGSNPAFDAVMLAKLFRQLEGRGGPQALNNHPWHHRMWDLSAYAAGVLRLDELPGLAKVCELLGIKPGDHTAETDVQATGLCFRELQRRAAGPC
jgi:DNA polymerase-3 subunit epsilon